MAGSSPHLLDIEIAGLHFALCSSTEIRRKKSELSYNPFIKTPELGSVSIPVKLEFEKLYRTDLLPRIFENEGPWSYVQSDGETYAITFSSESNEQSWSVLFDRHVNDVQVYHRGNMAEDVAANPFSYPLDQLLFIHVLAQHKGALIHSSSVDFGGKAFMFAGRSGAGKSTLSRQFKSAGHDVLSDDRIAVRRMGSNFWAFGTPWSGDAEIALNKGLPLKSIYFISHAGDNIIREMTPVEAAEKLMPVTSIPFYDKEAMLNILSFCEDLVLHVPAYELCFKPGVEVVDLLEEHISRQ